MKPNLICLTGGIATGKSKVGEWFEKKGWKVICTDKIVHQLYDNDSSLRQEMIEEFGGSICSSDGKIDRVELGEKIFSQKSMRERLNRLVHPKVRLEWKKQIFDCIQKTMVVIPLAYETEAQKDFAQTWVVGCLEQEQRKRLSQRGLNDEQIEQRLSSQWPLQKKIDLADIVIWNNASWSLTEEQLEMLIDGIPSENVLNLNK